MTIAGQAIFLFASVVIVVSYGYFYLIGLALRDAWDWARPRIREYIMNGE